MAPRSPSRAVVTTRSRRDERSRFAETTIGDVGEKGLIRNVLSRYATTARADRLDDAVVIDPADAFGAPELPLLVYSIDHSSLIDRPLPPGFEWRYHGRWLAACTCNDVLAMGAKPQGFSIDLAVPTDLGVDAVEGLYQGIVDVLGAYGVEFQGGNTDINPGIETAAMCWGTVGRRGIVRRSGARGGDLVAVTTPLGVGWSSYVLRKHGKFDALTATAREELKRYNLLPLAPHEPIVETVRRLPGAITSGMDLSDGLVEFLYVIAERSGFGVVIDEPLIPRPALLRECAALLDVPAAMLAFEYGFDMPRAHGYTVAPEAREAVEAIFEERGECLYVIGEVVEEPGVWWADGSGRRRLPELWDDKCHRVGVIERWFAFIDRMEAR